MELKLEWALSLIHQIGCQNTSDDSSLDLSDISLVNLGIKSDIELSEVI